MNPGRGPVLTPDLIDTTPPTPIKGKPKPLKKAKRATAEEKALYHKSTTLMLNKERYIRFRAALARHDRIAQELLTELIDQWMDKMDKKVKDLDDEQQKLPL